MSGIATAAIVSVGVGAYASHKAASKYYGAAGKAADTKAQAMARGQDIQKEMFEKQLELQKPYRQAGYNVLPELQMQATGQIPQLFPEEVDELDFLRKKKLNEESPSLTEEEESRFEELEYKRRSIKRLAEQGVPTSLDMMGDEQRDVYNALAQFTKDPLEENPYYQGRIKEGEEAINQAMAARGLQSSRPAINAIADYRRDLTGEMTQQRYGRLGQQYNTLQGARTNQFNRLLQTANIGQGATAQGVQATGQHGERMANLYRQQGQAKAQGIRQQGAIMGNMYSNLGAMPMNALSTYATGKQAGVFG